MLSLFTASAGLLANGVQPMAPATRLAAPMMKTSGVKVVVPDKCVACPHCSCPHCPGKYTGAETVCVCHSTDVEPWHNAGVLSAGVLPASGQPPPHTLFSAGPDCAVTGRSGSPGSTRRTRSRVP